MISMLFKNMTTNTEKWERTQKRDKFIVAKSLIELLGHPARCVCYLEKYSRDSERRKMAAAVPVLRAGWETHTGRKAHCLLPFCKGGQ